MSDDDGNSTSVRVIMWSVPRAISSAIAKCMSGIEGMEIWFEPYVYSYCPVIQYKIVTGDDLPMVYEGNEEAFDVAAKAMTRITGTKIEADRIPYATVKQNLEQTKSRYVFVKDMGFSVPDEETRKFIPAGYKHVFLIRHPVRVYLSYRTAMYDHLLGIGDLKGDSRDIDKFDLEVDDVNLPCTTFFKDAYNLWVYIRESGIDPSPIVLDADDLLMNPTEVLPRFCKAIGFPYSESLLHWDASTDILDTWKAAGDEMLKTIVNFYETAMKSSYFMPPRKEVPRDQLYPDVIKLSDESMKYYDELFSYKI